MRGFMHERARNGDALLLAAGKLARVFLRLLGNVHALQVLHGGLLGLGARHLLHPHRSKAQVVEHGEVGKQVEALEHHADFGADLVDLAQVVGELRAIDDDLALLMLLEPVDAADQRGFAGAGRTADDDLLALLHHEIDVTQHVKFAVPLVYAEQLNSRHAWLLVYCPLYGGILSHVPSTTLRGAPLT